MLVLTQREGESPADRAPSPVAALADRPPSARRHWMSIAAGSAPRVSADGVAAYGQPAAARMTLRYSSDNFVDMQVGGGARCGLDGSGGGCVERAS